jgi:hypothetical protein
MAKRMLKSNKVPACQRELTALLNAMDRKDKGDGNVNIRILQTALEHCLHASVNVLMGTVGGWSLVGLGLGWDRGKACKYALDLGRCVPVLLLLRSRITGENGRVATVLRFTCYRISTLCMDRMGWIRRLKAPPYIKDAAFFIPAHIHRLAARRKQKFEELPVHSLSEFIISPLIHLNRNRTRLRRWLRRRWAWACLPGPPRRNRDKRHRTGRQITAKKRWGLRGTRRREKMQASVESVGIRTSTTCTHIRSPVGWG